MEPPESLNPVLAGRSLSRVQRTILEAIVYLLRQGEIPTVREVGALVGRAPSTVLKHLRALETARLLSLSGKSRGIRIADRDLLGAVLGSGAVLGGGTVGGGTVGGGASEGTAASAAAPLPLPLEAFALRAPSAAGPGTFSGVPLVGAIAAGQPFESYAEGFLDGFLDGGFRDRASRGTPSRGASWQEGHSASAVSTASQELPIDPRMFAASGDVIAIRVEGDSMVQAGVLDGDYVMVRRQDTVEEGEIAAVLIDGEGTLKRWCTRRPASGPRSERQVRLLPANERFEPIVVNEDDGKDVIVIGKYVGLVRGEL
jgi:SOS-response transcriptional repressor LexA